MFYSYSITNGDGVPNPEIKDGIAKLSGKIINFHPNQGKDNRMLTLTVPHLITAEPYGVTTEVSGDGTFTFEVAMQCDYAIGFIRPKFQYNEFRVCLTSGKETKMEIIYEEGTGYIKSIHQTDSFGLTSDDLINLISVATQLIMYQSREITGYAKTPDEFVQRIRTKLNERLRVIEENNTISENAKIIITNYLKLLMLDSWFFDYRENMRLGYLQAGNKDIENFNPQEPDKKYYAFLKDFELNNPQYLYTGNYFSVLKKILSDETLRILPIGEMPIDQWMKDVKKILLELVGFDKGLFYDLLVAYSYTQQFDYQVKPLSDQQKENIRNYFKDGKSEIAKILLKKDNEIRKLAAQKEPLMVNETPAEPKEKLMYAIVSKYKGKVVVVDFWATWCVPCLYAMKQSAGIKAELKDRDVVFVYITNLSSPQKSWENRIIGIGGEHYYLNQDEWVYILDTFNFEVIPTYLIFDKKGNFVEKYVSYPGNEEMQKTIKELLPQEI